METEIRVGCCGWSYEDWSGSFYPDTLKQGQWLAYYAQHFDSVELDSTFYRAPSPSTVKRWYSQTPDSFQFTAKLPRQITHDAHLKDCDEKLRMFLDVMENLKEKLGPLHIQLPPDFKAEEWEALVVFLARLPKDFTWAIEFRHRSWLKPETYDLLRECGVSLAQVAHYYMPWVKELTADFVYCRWLGRRDRITQVDRIQIDRSEQMEKWAAAFRDLMGRVGRIYVFVNNRWAGHSPASVRALRELLGLPEPRASTGTLPLEV